MDHKDTVTFLLFGIIELLAIFLCNCSLLDGYKFPVYSTKSCPRNQTEWSERSSAINCTESNGFMCLPNQNFTELLEFCYFDHHILIQKGLCLFLNKRYSLLDDYNCTSFTEGCPVTNYRIYHVNKCKYYATIISLCKTIMYNIIHSIL